MCILSNIEVIAMCVCVIVVRCFISFFQSFFHVSAVVRAYVREALLRSSATSVRLTTVFVPAVLVRVVRLRSNEERCGAEWYCIPPMVELRTQRMCRVWRTPLETVLSGYHPARRGAWVSLFTVNRWPSITSFLSSAPLFWTSSPIHQHQR